MPPHLHALPNEILHEILSLIKHPHDLLSLALTSHYLYLLIVPAHIQYRLLRIRKPLPDVWAHLAKRKDLARTIWKVLICPSDDYSEPDIYPKNYMVLVESNPNLPPPTPRSPYEEKRFSWRTGFNLPSPTQSTFSSPPISPTLRTTASPHPDREDHERLRIPNMCQALLNMPHLEEFVWGYAHYAIPRPTIMPYYEDMILNALVEKKSLRKLSLSGAFGRHALDGKVDPDSSSYPGWKFKHLQALSLSGDFWSKPSNALHVRRLLSNSPNIQSLDIPMEFPFLPFLHFPNLTKLRLFLHSGGHARDIDIACSKFLAAHPSIEELCYYPIEDLRVDLGSDLEGELDTMVHEGMERCERSEPSAARMILLPPPPLHPFHAHLHKSVSSMPTTNGVGTGITGNAGIGTLLSATSLPNLKKLVSNWRFYKFLSCGKIKRKMEYLDLDMMTPEDVIALGLGFGPGTWEEGRGIDRMCLKGVRIHQLRGWEDGDPQASQLGSNSTWSWNATRSIGNMHITFRELDSWDGLKALELMGRVFPNLEQLNCPAKMTKARSDIVPELDTWLSLLSSFPNLTTFHGSGLWHAVEGNKMEMHKAIERLVKMCPRLGELDHLDVYQKMKARKRIVVIREEEGENVHYVVKKPRSRICFDVLGDHFQRAW